MTVSWTNKIGRLNPSSAVLRSAIFVPAVMILLLATGCGQQEDQKRFEGEAFSPPGRFTKTDFHGVVDSTEIDTDDWRVSPFFQGVVEVRPAWPNPVQSTDAVRIDIYITGVDYVTGLVLRHYNYESSVSSIIFAESGTFEFGETPIHFNAAELFSFDDPESRLGLYRVILFDANDNVISYGDIQVE